MEPCFRERLQSLCISRYDKYRSVELGKPVVAVRWEGANLHCSIDHVSKGVIKAASLELRNLLLQRCEASTLTVRPPTPGISSLPPDALARSLGRGHDASALSDRWRFDEFVSKLEQNLTVPSSLTTTSRKPRLDPCLATRLTRPSF